MSRWSDIAAWRGPTVNQSGAMREQRGVVVHIAEGTFEGTIAWQRNPDANVSSHFIVARDGRIAQMVDTDVTAWTQSAGNGHWLSVENEGFTPKSIYYRQGWEVLTPQQVEANARVLAKAHQVHGVPLQLAVNPDGRGLGHHSMGCNWPGGAWGHCDCPGPAIIAQKQAILDRAIAIVNGDSNMEQSDTLTSKTNFPNRSVGNALADIANLRDAMIGSGVAYPPEPTNYPKPGSPLHNMANLPKLLAEHAAAPVDPSALAAALTPLLDAMEGRLEAKFRDAIADLGEKGAAGVRAEQ